MREPGCEVISDGLACFTSLAKAGMTHTAITRGRPRGALSIQGSNG